MLKHVGKVGEKPCIVLFREVPLNEEGTQFDTENCLVIETAALAPAQHDALMSVIQSAEAQETHELSQVLNRRTFPDGTNMLSELHYSKKINKVPVDLVKLSPTPSQDLPLGEVNAEIRKIKNGSNPPSKTQVDPVKADSGVSVDTNVNSQMLNNMPDTTNLDESEKEAMAKNLLAQADLIEGDLENTLNSMKADADSKRAQAYELAPDLKPKRGPGRPPKT